MSRNAAMLWTGGKDCSLALHEAAESGCHIRCLVTFAPPRPTFLAHPIAFMRIQSQALAIPHFMCPVRPPFADSYEAGLRYLRDELAIDTIITGDIAEVGGAPNWIRERNRQVGLNVLMPLWGRDRQSLLEQLIIGGFKVIFSCVRIPTLSPDWIGRALTTTAIDELGAIRKGTGLDLCGEEGEYHTLTLDGPRFERTIRLSFARKRSGSLAHIDIEKIELLMK
jgi:diphthine-ammonia ligase